MKKRVKVKLQAEIKPYLKIEKAILLHPLTFQLKLLENTENR